MTLGRSRGKVWRACASAWAQLPPAAVQAGDRAAESVVRQALDLAVRFLSTGGGKDTLGDGLEADWVTAAFATLDRDGDGLVGYEEFVDIVEQYWDLAALAGNGALAGVVSNQVRPVQEEQDGREAQVERLCGQAFLWVDPEGVEALTMCQAKTALAVVFNCIGVPNPPDEWHTIAFQNFDEDGDGLIEFEEMHEIALQHCELVWEGKVQLLPEPVGPAVETSGRCANYMSEAATTTTAPTAAVPAAACAPPGSSVGAVPGSYVPGSSIEVLASVLQEQGKPRAALDEALLSKEECRRTIAISLQRVPGSILPPDEWCDVAFGNFDEDGDGHITAEEAAEILEEWLTLRPPEPGTGSVEKARTSASAPAQSKSVPDASTEAATELFKPPPRIVSQDSGSATLPSDSMPPLVTESSASAAAAPPAQQPPQSSALAPSPVLETGTATVLSSLHDTMPAAVARTSEPAAPGQAVSCTKSLYEGPPAAPSPAAGITEAIALTTSAVPATHAMEVGASTASAMPAAPAMNARSSTTTGMPPAPEAPAALTPSPSLAVAPEGVADATEHPVASAMATAISRKTVVPRKTVRLDDAAPVTHEIPGTQHRGTATTILTSTASSLKSEVYDIYGTFVGNSTSSEGTMAPRKRLSTAALSHRKSLVPVAAQILTPAYSGQLRVFSDYDFFEEKGGGAFGRVMSVKHKRMGLQRACKAVAIRGARQFELVETEVSLMRKLDHPNVLRLFESYYDGDRNIYLIIELCNGGSLTDRMAAHRQEAGGGGLPEVEAASAMQDLLTALQYCHRKGIIHRDIKPDNLLYVCKASDSQLKVIDFGLSDFLAKIEQKAHEQQKQSDQKDKKKRAAPRIGTPHYMAAEVYLEGIYDERVDTFACGVVLAEALTGVHPFFELSKDNLESIRAKILRGKVDFKARHWDPVPVLAKQLAGQLLEPDRRKRYDASQALAHPWLRNRSLSAGKAPEVKRQVFDGLSRFRRYNVLKQAASRVIAKQLDDTQLRTLQQQFHLLDADSSGSLSAAELQEGARCCGRRMELVEVLEILQGFDRIQSTRGAEIYYTDFLAAMLEYGVTLSEPLLQEVYMRFSDSAGKISWRSLEAAIRAVRPSGIAPGMAPPVSVPASGTGEDATELELGQVFAELGGVDQCIDFRAFASMWVPQERL